MMMEAVCSYNMLVTIYKKTTWSHSPDNNNINSHWCGNLKCQCKIFVDSNIYTALKGRKANPPGLTGFGMLLSFLLFAYGPAFGSTADA